LGGCGLLSAAEILMKDGRILKGRLGMVNSLADQPMAPDAEMGPLRLTVLVDDDLRRTFVAKRQIQEVRQANVGQVTEEAFNIRQRVLRSGIGVKSVGPVMKITPFDEFGRRIFTFNTPKGPVDIIQGITEINPTWTKVEGISHVWDMRMATSSVPPDTLRKILLKQINPKDIEHHKKVARFYLQCERYKDAQQTLEGILKAFPDQPNLEDELAGPIRSLRQLQAQRLLSELKLRRKAGQHRMALASLKGFPSDNVAGEILQSVREMIQEYEGYQADGRKFYEQFDALLARVENPQVRAQLTAARDELRAELNINTLGRTTAFVQHLGDADLSPETKLSLAVSGWLAGSDAATEKLPVALSWFRVRDLVLQYVNEPIKMNRERIFEVLKKEEGAAPTTVVKLLANMKPPVPPGSLVDPNKPGYYRIETPGLPSEPPISYLVQTPPEYDPHRRYPTIVTLRGAGTTAENQVDWWAGAWGEGQRYGQAGRYGYIVIAPDWAVEHQKEYGYSAREHVAVLNSLRDACRKFSIDTDRVFLTGHSFGGDAAWDIGLAHPDLWAGVIPIVAQTDRYVQLYWENAELLPLYFVCGEYDGAKMTKNAQDIDRYMKRGYNCTVVEYLGRGHEHFYDEILRIFDWMDRYKRDFYPREFECSTMRPWDNFFWWVELSGMPPKAMVEPANWPPPRGVLPVQVSAKLTEANGVYIKTGTGQVSVWVSPQMLSFQQRVNIVVNGDRINSREPFVQGDLHTLLEDVRTRGDRQHPFWARFDAQTGRVN
jgi:acetyl esterase/lipase